MQDIVIRNVLIIQKSQLKAYVRREMLKRPGLMSHVTNRSVLEALIFIKGYASAIEKDIMLPVIKAEVQQLLLEQGLKYIIQKIESTLKNS